MEKDQAIVLSEITARYHGAGALAISKPIIDELLGYQDIRIITLAGYLA